MLINLKLEISMQQVCLLMIFLLFTLFYLIIEFLLENIFIRFGTKLYRQVSPGCPFIPVLL